ncbi:MAG: 50S ribosomal protein L6 [Chlamydiae bacterium]|nr:50S ribosomal protein L6 [Chlamydiota bacterium]
MSRLGRIPVVIPKGVELKVAGNKVNVKGAKGNLSLDLPTGITLKIDQGSLVVEMDKSLDSEFHGLYRSLINNMIVGVDKGYEKTLNLIGVGYRAALKGNKLDLQLGFSHPMEIEIPKEVKIQINKQTEIIISGCDKQIVGHFAALVRSVKPPEPYKGKGIRYVNEYVRKKEGKAAKAAAAK